MGGLDPVARGSEGGRLAVKAGVVYGEIGTVVGFSVQRLFMRQYVL